MIAGVAPPNLNFNLSLVQLELQVELLVLLQGQVVTYVPLASARPGAASGPVTRTDLLPVLVLLGYRLVQY